MAFGVGMVLVAGLAAQAAAGERVIARSHRIPPAWVAAAPTDSKDGTTYFVGVKEEASSLRSGREEAYQDAARQAVGFVRTRVAQRFRSVKGDAEPSTIDEIASTASGNLNGLRIVDTYWDRREQPGWFFRKDYFRVWVLVGVPDAEIEGERARLRNLASALRERLTALCRTQAAWLLSHAAGRPVAVGGFAEASSNKAYAFSRIIEDEFSGCLTRKGVPVVRAGRQDISASGSYYRTPVGGIVVAATLTRLSDGARLAAGTVTIPEDAVEPTWLRLEKIAEDDFFAGLDRWGKRRASERRNEGIEAGPSISERIAGRTQPEAAAEVLSGGNLDTYLDLLGGAAAVSNAASYPTTKRNDLLAELHFFKYIYFVRRIPIGIGTSVFATYWGPWKMRVRKTTAGGVQESEQSPNVASLLPVHLVLAPFGRRMIGASSVGAPMLYYNFSAWGLLNLESIPASSRENLPWNSMFHDAGLLLPIGHWLALKAGYFQLNQPAIGFSKQGLNPQAKPVTTRWDISAIRDHRWYVGLELHIGGIK